MYIGYVQGCFVAVKVRIYITGSGILSRLDVINCRTFRDYKSLKVNFARILSDPLKGSRCSGRRLLQYRKKTRRGLLCLLHFSLRPAARPSCSSFDEFLYFSVQVAEVLKSLLRLKSVASSSSSSCLRPTCWIAP